MTSGARVRGMIDRQIQVVQRVLMFMLSLVFYLCVIGVASLVRAFTRTRRHGGGWRTTTEPPPTLDQYRRES